MASSFALLLIMGMNAGKAQSVLVFSSADTTLSQNWAQNNLGGLRFANSGTTQNFTTNRALIRFNVAEVVPAGSQITSAELVWEVTREPDDGYNSSTFGVHRLLQDWGEGDNVSAPGGLNPGSGSPADLGESNWTHRFAGTTETWGVPGGLAGLDYSAQASGSTAVYGIGQSPYSFGSTPGTIADAQFWLDNPAANFGWILISQSEELDFTARRFGSREDPVNAPYLLLHYLPVPEPSTPSLLVIGFAALLRRFARR
jgi:hypothetical protein